MAKHVVVSGYGPIEIDGRHYYDGEQIAVPAQSLQQLLELGAIAAIVVKQSKTKERGDTDQE